MTLRLFRLGILIIGFLACQRLPTALNVQTQSSIFPLIPGSYWQYKETIDTTYIFTREVIGTDRSNNHWIYRVVTRYPNWETEVRYFIKNDSVFEAQPTRLDTIWALKYYVPRKDHETFRMFLGGDVVISGSVSRLDTLIQTPAGKFTRCYRFTRKLESYGKVGLVEFSEYLVPGVGLVLSIEKNSTTHEVIRRVELQSYRIGRN